jgi:two-component system KDP operon response regulator KdpE
MNIKPRILLIEDEPQMQRALRTLLSAQYQTASATTGEQGLTLAAAHPPDVIILDLGLPDMDGVEVCTRLRQWSQVPIIVLSVRDTESGKVAALDGGADDYLTKPFGIEELLARIRVALRHATRAQGSSEVVVAAGPLTIDLARHVVTREGLEVCLTATEFKVLAYLAANAGRVLTHHNIMTHVWASTEAQTIAYLRIYIGQLRRKLEEDPQHPRVLITAPGVGYRLIADD